MKRAVRVALGIVLAGAALLGSTAVASAAPDPTASIAPDEPGGTRVTDGT